MTKKILISSTQYPYYGGAATNAYALIKYLRQYDYNVAGLFFENKNVNIDPDNIGGIWKCESETARGKLKYDIVSYLGGWPHYVLAKNYAAPIYSKELFPGSKIIYLVTGSPQMMELSRKNISAKKYLQSSEVINFETERKSVISSDLVIPNSDLGKELLYKNYGSLNKILNPIDTSMALNNIQLSVDLKPFKSRRYDIAFVCSNLNRTVKNAKLALDIFKSFPKSNKIVIGNNNGSFKEIPNTVVVNPAKHKTVLAALSNSKITLCTSYYDASPNIVREALLCNSNILLSQNCGWSNIYPEDFVCEDVYNLKEWNEKVSILKSKDVEFNFNSLLKSYSLIDEFKRIIL